MGSYQQKRGDGERRKRKKKEEERKEGKERGGREEKGKRKREKIVHSTQFKYYLVKQVSGGNHFLNI